MAVTPPQTDSGREDKDIPNTGVTDTGDRKPARPKGLSAASPAHQHKGPLLK